MTVETVDASTIGVGDTVVFPHRQPWTVLEVRRTSGITFLTVRTPRKQWVFSLPPGSRVPVTRRSAS